MTHLDERDEELETLVDRAILDLPGRRAPVALERRVALEIQRRAVLPWWRRSFAQWSVPARSAFVTACGVMMTLMTMVQVGSGDSRYVRILTAWVLDRLHAAESLMASADAVAALLARLVPGEWWGIGLGLGVLFYGVLFGLGAAAYRLLYLEPSKAGVQ